MSILSGFKRYKDYLKTDNGYQLMSRWTKSDAVVMGDGTDDANTLEKNLGAIKGISSSLTSDSENIALSCSAGKILSQSIGTYFGSYSIESGSTSYVIENANISTTSDITVSYAEDSEDIIRSAKPKYKRSDGALTIIFQNSLEGNATIEYIEIKNPKVVSS